MYTYVKKDTEQEYVSSFHVKNTCHATEGPENLEFPKKVGFYISASSSLIGMKLILRLLIIANTLQKKVDQIRCTMAFTIID